MCAFSASPLPSFLLHLIATIIRTYPAHGCENLTSLRTLRMCSISSRLGRSRYRCAPRVSNKYLQTEPIILTSNTKIHAHAHTRTHTRTHAHTISNGANVLIDTDNHTYTHAHTNTNAHRGTHTNSRAHMHIRTRVHTRTCTDAPPSGRGTRREGFCGRT